LRFRSLDDGTRMVKFDLVPDLQVSRVAWNGRDIPFIQESRTTDGSFYLQTPEPLVKGHTYQVTFEYSGGEVLQSRFGAVPPRRVWYPTPAGPASRATYDLTFDLPRGATVVSVGKQVRQTRDGALDVSEWSSDVPLAQAAFRYLSQLSGRGVLKIYDKTTIDQTTGMELSAYVISPPPPQPSPVSAGDLLIDTGNSVRVFNDWFGPPAYGHLSVVVMRGATDSLPGLVYASPGVVAGYSSLMTNALVNAGEVAVRSIGPLTHSNGGADFVGPDLSARTSLDEAFSLQVAGQWWANTVSPATFHDAWLTSGFENFSTSLYDLAVDPAEFRDHWVRARVALLYPPPLQVPCRWCSDMRPNDTGPVWMGVLNDTFKTPDAGSIVSTSKGGYILHMLRSLMWDPQKGDADFRATMQDFVRQFANQAVSTEDFKSVVEKHMKPPMDMDGNHRMDWFFDEWLLGTDVPSYRLEYSLGAAKDGKPLLTGKLTQSGVSPGFRMIVPVFAEFAGKKSRVTVMAMRGNSTRDFKEILPERPKRILLNLNRDVLTDKEEVTLVK
jgi:hypothetical protein